MCVPHIKWSGEEERSPLRGMESISGLPIRRLRGPNQPAASHTRRLMVKGTSAAAALARDEVAAVRVEGVRSC